VPRRRAGQVGSLYVTPWFDPLSDAAGHDVRSVYVERFWLPVLGPTSTWVLRRLAEGLEHHRAGYRVDLGLLARSLGLGGTGSRSTAFFRNIQRTSKFGLTRFVDDDTIEVRRRVPDLTPQMVNRLPTAVRADLRAWEEVVPSVPDAQLLRDRAKRLALSLLELGEEREAIEAQLLRWRFHPAMAHEAVTWAGEMRQRAEQPLDAA
jgi:hypothetical protein